MMNFDLERLVLSEFLNLENLKEYRKYKSALKPEYFFNPNLKAIFLKACEFIQEGKEPQIFYLYTLWSKDSTERYEIEQIQVNPPVTTAGLEVHADKLREHYQATSATKLLHESSKHLESSTDPVIIENLIHSLKTLKQDCSPGNDKPTATQIMEAVQEYEAIEANTFETVVPYKMSYLDRIIFLCRGQVHVIAAQSGTGKTGLSLSFMLNQIEGGMKIIYFCCETRAIEIINRMSCIKSGAKYVNLLQKFKDRPELKKAFIDSMTHLYKHSANFHIFGLGEYAHSIPGIEGKLLSLTRHDEQFDMIYIDYLQALKLRKGIERHESIEQDMQEICRIAQEYNVAVTLLSQFNRTKGVKEDAEVTHLKGSSSIENYAHLVSFLQQKEKDIPPNAALVDFELKSGKCRLQPPFTAQLQRTISGGFIERQQKTLF